MLDESIDEKQLSKVMAALGRRGGRARSRRKVAACMKNLEAANAAKQRLRVEQQKWVDEPVDTVDKGDD